MAPRTRSCRGLSREEAQAQEKAISAGLVNTRGLPALPPELLLEIVDHFPSVPIPFLFSFGPYLIPLGSRYRDQGVALRIISQLCRSLRHTLLPQTWRHLEVCAMGTRGKRRQKGLGGRSFALWEKDIATELVKQLEIVTIRDSSLAQHVQVVSVFIGAYCSDTVTAELARCLALFPNIRTFQLTSASYKVINDVNRAFTGYKYRTIRTLAIPAQYLTLLASCPEVKNLYLSGYQGGYSMYKTIQQYAPHIETLGGNLDMGALPDIVSIRTLKVVQLPVVYYGRDQLADIALLSGLPNLTTIEFMTWMTREQLASTLLTPLVSAALRVLMKLSHKDDVRPSVRVVGFANGELFKTVYA